MQSKGLRELLKAGDFSRNRIKNDKYNSSRNTKDKTAVNGAVFQRQKTIPSNRHYFADRQIIFYNRFSHNYSRINLEEFVV